MQFTQQNSSGGAVMALNGAFTFKDHHSFRSLMDQLRASTGHHHVLDLSDVDFVDSAALGMLLIANDEAKSAGWTLRLRRPSTRVARLLSLSAMDSIFDIET